LLATLALWQNFYVIVGSAAAALIGLQFVVIVLGASLNVIGSAATTSAFGTPTIVHFGAVLLLAAILTAPWPEPWALGLALAACGVAGLVYALVVIARTRRQTQYEPVLEDWVWHCILPLASYGVLFVAGLLLRRDPSHVLFVIGGVALLLLFIGIHNAWDSVTFVALKRASAGSDASVNPAGDR